MKMRWRAELRLIVSNDAYVDYYTLIEHEIEY